MALRNDAICNIKQVEKAKVGEIISRFEKKGFSLKVLKFINVDNAFAKKHYADLSAKPFFNGLVEYIVSGPVVAMVWEGKGAVLTDRKIIGTTNPLASEPGTIRGDFAIDIGRSLDLFIPQLLSENNVDHIFTWVLSNEVTELTIDDSHIFINESLPDSLFKCEKLTHLTLYNCKVVNLPPTFKGFKNLLSFTFDNLIMFYGYNFDGNVMSNIISKSKKLERISLNILERRIH